MVLRYKTRQQKSETEDNLRKVLIYGMDGSGKSTFAETYSREHNLNPIVIDIDDTNYTSLPLVEFKRDNDSVLFKELKTVIKDIGDSEFDTVIIDGVSSLLELLISNNRGMSKYADRTSRWNKLLNELLLLRKHLIFIGQIDMVVIEGETSKAVVNVNSIVNEKYRCIYDGKKYTHKVEKFRGIESTETTEPKKVSPPKKVEATERSGSSFKTADKIDTTKSSSRLIAEDIISSFKHTPTMIECVQVLDNKFKAQLISHDEAQSVFKELEVLLNC